MQEIYPLENKIETVRKRMSQAKIFEEDIEESFIHSSGPGGQNTNKVATCVCLYHRPTGFRIKCQKTRSQGVNRRLARQWLLKDVERQRHSETQREAQRIAKIKRQNRKRSQRIQEKILAQKHHVSQKKAVRGKISTHRIDLDG